MEKVADRKDSFHIPLDFDTALSGLLRVNPANMPAKPIIKEKIKVKAKAKAEKKAARKAAPKKRN